MWILGSLSKEILFFVLPGLLSVLVAILYPNLGEVSLFYALIATALIDSGHVYTTVWRTYFHREERTSHKAYLIWPVIFFSLFSLWYYFAVPGLWSFVVYATLYHHVRQFYGFSKWYQAINRRTDKLSDLFLYTFALIPFLAYHLRSGVAGGYYTKEDIFFFPNERLFQAMFLLEGTVICIWMVREISLWRNGTREINRVFSVGFPAMIYAYCFFIGSTITQVLFPLLFVHGISYFGVMGQSLVRTRKEDFRGFTYALVVIVSTALLFGSGESWLEEEMVNIISALPATLAAMLIGLSLTPLFCHYAFDAIIWKKSHREAGVVFRQESVNE